MSLKQTQYEIFELDHKNKKIGISNNDLSIKSFEPKFPTQLCIKVACSLIVIIISFTLGVERGKIISKNKISSSYLGEVKTQKTSGNMAVKNTEVAVKNETIKKPTGAIKKIEKEVNNDKAGAFKYVIQVVTYKKNSSYIDKEIAKLKQNGYSALVIPSGNWIQICAGNFTEEKVAKEHLRKLRQTYKDCSIRKI